MSKNDLKVKKENTTIYMYVVMPRLGMNLHDFFSQKKASFTEESIYSLGIQLVNILEKVHQAGLIFNDLKLDNLLLDFDADVKQLKKDANTDIFASNNINIIDFGFATPYLKEDGTTHVKKSKLDYFRGNMMFSSVNQLKFHTTSRRDDLISVFYILVYLLKQGNMPGIELNNDYDPNQVFDEIKETRRAQKSKDLCFGNTKELKTFKKEVFSYNFADEPRYDYLRSSLVNLRDHNTDTQT